MVPSAPEAVLTEAAELTDEVRALLSQAAAADGIAPISDGLLEAAGDDPWIMLEARADEELIGFGIAAAQGERGALEAVIAPAARGRGYGRALIDALIARAGHPVWMWSHGDHPAAAAIAAAHGFSRARELLQLQTGPVSELDLPDRPAPDGVTLRSFAPGDEPGWLAVNNAAFDWHPEQGHQELADIEAIVSAPASTRTRSSSPPPLMPRAASRSSGSIRRSSPMTTPPASGSGRSTSSPPTRPSTPAVSVRR